MIVLDLAGWNAAEADGGAAAIEYLANNPQPDIVISDLMMPGMSGLEFIRAVRGHPAQASIPILVVSASHDSPDGAEAATLANGIMSKDDIVRDLVPSVRRAIGGAPAGSVPGMAVAAPTAPAAS